MFAGPWLVAPGIFSGWAKFIVMQISFIMLIFLLFSDQISGKGKLPQGGLSGTKPANSVTAVMWVILQTYLSTHVHIQCPGFNVHSSLFSNH